MIGVPVTSSKFVWRSALVFSCIVCTNHTAFCMKQGSSVFSLPCSPMFLFVFLFHITCEDFINPSRLVRLLRNAAYHQSTTLALLVPPFLLFTHTQSPSLLNSYPAVWVYHPLPLDSILHPGDLVFFFFFLLWQAFISFFFFFFEIISVPPYGGAQCVRRVCFI